MSMSQRQATHAKLGMLSTHIALESRHPFIPMVASVETHAVLFQVIPGLGAIPLFRILNGTIAMCAHL